VPDRKVLFGAHGVQQHKNTRAAWEVPARTLQPTWDAPTKKVENLGILAVQIRRSQPPRP